MALSVYGEQRFKHVLTPLLVSRCNAFCVRLLLGCGLATLGCADVQFSPLSGASSAPAIPAQRWQYAFPTDHDPHPEQGAELWQLFGTLITQDGSEFVTSTKLLSVAFGQTVLAPRVSQWQFQQVHGISHMLVDTQASSHTGQVSVAREALQLAGYDKARGEIWVNQHSLKLSASGACELAIDINYAHSDNPFRWEMASSSCPNLPESVMPTVNHGYSLSLEIASGSLHQRALRSGRYWLVHSWGSLPAADSPVFIDQFYLPWNNESLLEVVRTRRADGGGSPVVSARLHAAGRIQTLDYRRLQLTDQKKWSSAATANTYSHGWTLAVPGYRVNLEPIVADQEVNAFGLMRWSGAVRMDVMHDSSNIAGALDPPETRTVYGFAELSSLPAEAP